MMINSKDEHGDECQDNPLQYKFAISILILQMACEFLVLIELLQTIAESVYKPHPDHQLYCIGLICTILLENWSGFLPVLDKTTLSLSHQKGKAKNRSHFMRLYTLPLLDL